MEVNTTNYPIFKRIDRYVFEQIDRFKLSPNYTQLQDFYNSLEEEHQKLFKGLIIIVLFLFPALFLGGLAWQVADVRSEYEMREEILTTGQMIINERQGVKDVSPQILSQSPIDRREMMNSRLSNLLSSSGIDISKLTVGDFNTTMLSDTVMRSDTDIRFSNVSTDELMNAFISLIQREKFRIESVDIRRNAENNLLSGQFHAIHFSAVTAGGATEDFE